MRLHIVLLLFLLSCNFPVKDDNEKSFLVDKDWYLISYDKVCNPPDTTVHFISGVNSSFDYYVVRYNSDGTGESEWKAGLLLEEGNFIWKITENKLI